MAATLQDVAAFLLSMRTPEALNFEPNCLAIGLKLNPSIAARLRAASPVQIAPAGVGSQLRN